MKRRTPIIALLAVAGPLLVVACSAKPKPVAAREAKPIVAAASPSPTVVSPPAPAVGMEPTALAPVRISVEEMNRKGYVKDAFFDYDRYDLRPDQRDTLTKDAAWLREHPTVKIMVEGHCDERGTSQ